MMMTYETTRPRVDVSVSGLSKSYKRNGAGTLDVLEDLSFEVYHGELLCVVGPSGCGKTTLLRIVQGLEPPTQGTVWVNPDSIRKGSAYVQQSSVLLPWRTLIQNAALGLEVRGLLDRVSSRALYSTIEEFGLKDFEESLPGELSGGMKQRTALIRALASKPRLLFCDEPFSAVDFVTRLRLNTLFKKLCLVGGITTVFVTHNIEEAIFLGTRVIVLGGKPAHILEEYRPHLSEGAEDAVKCRSAPEFRELFERIWGDLRRGHEEEF